VTNEGLYSVVLRLCAKDAGGTVHGRLVHAAFLSWMRAADPALAVELHQDGQARPFTVAILPNADVSSRDLLLRCTFLDDRLHAAFLTRLNVNGSSPIVRLGDASYSIDAAPIGAGVDGWTRRSTWQEVAATATSCHEVDIEFYTPTCFSRDDGSPRKRLELFPQPEWVWRSWAAKWGRFGPASLPVESAAEQARRWVLVSGYTLQTATLNYGRFKQKGFRGVIGYELQPGTPEAAARLLNALADFAFYGGTGYKTAMGLGQTRRLQSGLRGADRQATGGRTESVVPR